MSLENKMTLNWGSPRIGSLKGGEGSGMAGVGDLVGMLGWLVWVRVYGPLEHGQ
jgi:hypothetical protein